MVSPECLTATTPPAMLVKIRMAMWGRRFYDREGSASSVSRQLARPAYSYLNGGVKTLSSRMWRYDAICPEYRPTPENNG
jgi:hypothetical protein